MIASHRTAPAANATAASNVIATAAAIAAAANATAAAAAVCVGPFRRTTWSIIDWGRCRPPGGRPYGPDFCFLPGRREGALASLLVLLSLLLLVCRGDNTNDQLG